MPPDPKTTYVGTREAARRLGVSRQTIVRWILSGDLPATRYHEDGHWRISEEDLGLFAVRHKPSSGARRPAPRLADSPTRRRVGHARAVAELRARGVCP